MKKIDSSLSDFLGIVSVDFNGLIGKIQQMKDNIDQLRKETDRSSNLLNAARLRDNTAAASRGKSVRDQQTPRQQTLDKLHKTENVDKK